MDLQRIVGIGPGDARGEQLGHARLDVAPSPLVLLARCEIGELARRDRLSQHHDELVGDAREIEDGLAELSALQRIAEAQLIGSPADADGARRRLDAGALEGAHQLAETLALLAAKQAVGGDREAIEHQFIFAHPAIAEHPNLAARHAGGGEGGMLRPARLGRKEHREARIARSAGAREQRHQIGARGVGDPGLGARHPPAIHGSGRAGLEVGKVGAVGGLGEDGGGEHLARRDPRQPSGLLRVGATGRDQLARNLRSCAKRAGADPAAREFLGDHTHFELAEAETAMFGGDADAKGAERGQFPDQRIRHQRVGKVPAMRVGRDPLGGEAAILVADRIDDVVAHLLGDGAAVADMSGERRTGFGGRAHRDDPRGFPEETHGIEPELLRAHQFIGADRQTACDLGGIFPEGDGKQQAFRLAKPPACLQCPRPGEERLQCGDRRLDPREAVRGALLGIERAGLDPGAHALPRLACEAAGGGGGACKQRQRHATSPASCSLPIAPDESPSSSASTMSLCSPSRGARVGGWRVACGIVAIAPGTG